MEKLLTLCLLLFLGTVSLLAQSGTLSGKITDAQTGEPLIGATIQLQGTDLGSATDVDGFYTITGIPPKTYNIEAAYLGYTPQTKYNVVIRSEGNIDINFELAENVFELDDVVVRPNPFEKLRETPLSVQRLSQEEVAAYPGGNNDIAKVVQSLPGVSGSVGGFRNDVIIRGGAPNENVYYLDGVEIPNINHFSTQGSAGGPVGLLNVSFFEGVTLTTSSFAAQYDNVLSGILQFDQRRGNAQEFKANIRVGASEAALTVEGPLFKGEEKRAKTTYIASVRRSYLQFLFEVIGLPFLPDYYDYQYKVAHQINDYNELIITGVGSIDDLAINALETFDPAQQAIQDQIPVIQQNTNAAGITWNSRFKDNSGAMQTTISTNLLNNTFRQYSDNVNRTGLFLENDSREQETKIRYRLSQFFGNWTASYGFSLQYVNYDNTTQNFVNDFSYTTSLDFWRYGLFGQLSGRLAKDRLGVTFGLRADGNTFTDTGNEIYRTLSPRASVSYKLNEAGDWTINASVGRYYKIAPYTILGFQNNQGEFENRSADYTRSDHLVAGVEYLIGRSARVTLEGFYKRYDNYPISAIDSISLANKGGGFEVLGNEPVVTDGLGRTYGLELLFQQKFEGNFYAIVAYTLYKSEFTGFDPDRFIPSTWDNGQLLTLTGGYKFRGNWEVSTRFRFLGPTPFPPVDQEATLANYPAVVLDYSRLGEEELAPFNQLDIRVDKKWNFEKWSLDVYLEVQNALFSELPAAPQYGLARDEQGQVLEPLRLELIPSDSDAPVIPTVGLVINI